MVCNVGCMVCGCGVEGHLVLGSAQRRHGHFLHLREHLLRSLGFGVWGGLGWGAGGVGGRGVWGVGWGVGGVGCGVWGVWGVGWGEHLRLPR